MKLRIFGMIFLLVGFSIFAIGCPGKNNPTSVKKNNSPSNTPTSQVTSTPTPEYGYVDVSFQGNSLNIWCWITAYVDGSTIGYSMGTNGVCSKRLVAGSHTVQIQISGGCPDGTPARLYYTSSGVTSYGSLWTWNLNIQPGADYYFELDDYN